DKAVVSPGPDRVPILVRRRHGVNDAAAWLLGHFRCAKDADAFRHVRLLARKVGTDDVPALAAVRRLEEHIAAEIEDVRINRRKKQRRSAQKAIFSGTADLRPHVLHLSRGAVETADLAAIDEIGIERIGRDVAVLFDADRTPFAKGDLAIVAPAGDAGRAALLLASVDPVGELVIGDDVVKLRGGLVVPRAPRLPAVDTDD